VYINTYSHRACDIYQHVDVAVSLAVDDEELVGTEVEVEVEVEVVKPKRRSLSARMVSMNAESCMS